jgi:hypothetical protein
MFAIFVDNLLIKFLFRKNMLIKIFFTLIDFKQNGKLEK